jgi:sortase A
MTVVTEGRSDADEAATPPPFSVAQLPGRRGAGAAQGQPERRPLLPVTPRRIAAVGAAWLGVTVVGIGLVIYGLGPMLEQRDQRHLLADYRVDIEQSANEAFGLPGVEEITEAPEVGDPVAIVDIPSIRFRQVVVEGVGPQRTRHGPGHVPGTAGPGQPGNSAIVGRQGAFGGPFSEIDHLETGDEILVTTVQGQTVYVVSDERHGKLSSASASAEDDTSTAEAAADDEVPDPAATTTTTVADDAGSGSPDRGSDEPSIQLAKRLTIDEVYGPSQDDDRLTMITSGSASPLATNPATVVVAQMKTRPFEPTPQGGRSRAQDGRNGDGTALAPFVLAFMGYAAAGAAAVLLYRRTRPRSAYLMSAPLLVVATVLIAEAAARLLPAWF